MLKLFPGRSKFAGLKFPMRPLFEIATDPHAQADVLRARSHGVIEVRDGRLRRVRLRPFPKIVSLPEIMLLGEQYHRRRAGDRCLLFYDQPRRFPNFLSLKYVLSARDTTLASIRTALRALDEIARLKGSDAIVCDVFNWRISERLLGRLGWESHKPSRWHRHYIKRFYGDWPAPLAPGELTGDFPPREKRA